MNNKKYIDDEQVKKNIEEFRREQEDNKRQEEIKVEEEKIKKENEEKKIVQEIENEEEELNNEENSKEKNSGCFGPCMIITISICIFIIYPFLFGGLDGMSAFGFIILIPFLIIFLLNMWMFYSLNSIAKSLHRKEKEEKGLVLIFLIISIIVFFVFTLYIFSYAIILFVSIWGCYYIVIMIKYEQLK